MDAIVSKHDQDRTAACWEAALGLELNKAWQASKWCSTSVQDLMYTHILQMEPIPTLCNSYWEAVMLRTK
jgi:hypothetical protein